MILMNCIGSEYGRASVMFGQNGHARGKVQCFWNVLPMPTRRRVHEYAGGDVLSVEDYFALLAPIKAVIQLRRLCLPRPVGTDNRH